MQIELVASYSVSFSWKLLFSLYYPVAVLVAVVLLPSLHTVIDVISSSFLHNLLFFSISSVQKLLIFSSFLRPCYCFCCTYFLWWILCIFSVIFFLVSLYFFLSLYFLLHRDLSALFCCSWLFISLSFYINIAAVFSPILFFLLFWKSVCLAI